MTKDLYHKNETKLVLRSDQRPAQKVPKNSKPHNKNEDEANEEIERPQSGRRSGQPERTWMEAREGSWAQGCR